MKKIPTIFERDWNGDRSRVLDKVTPGCEWVFAGEGRATIKLDGTCCLIRDGKLFKRREVKGEPPADFEEVDFDPETGKRVGWVPVSDGPEDKYHREAMADFLSTPPDGTYELIGPKVQGGVEMKSGIHMLILHGSHAAPECPRTFDGIRSFLADGLIEGIVWHHPDGRMAKIKGRDFGIKRKPS